jgi:hypothetical protein
MCTVSADALLYEVHLWIRGTHAVADTAEAPNLTLPCDKAKAKKGMCRRSLPSMSNARQLLRT